jgi:twitching motility protein PilT
MIDVILRKAIALGASDVLVQVGLPPIFRINTECRPMEHEVQTAEGISRLARGMTSEKAWDRFLIDQDLDFAYDMPGEGRFRVNVHFQRGSVALSIRIFNNEIRSLETLLLPEVVGWLTSLPRGLVLVTGATGSGKSTTLAAMIDLINTRDAGHIITIEDPIEYVYTPKRCAVEQREVRIDVPDFARGLKHVLRQDPDTIFVGEIRDVETARAAINAAETGHLVLSTLHTNNAPQTIERIVGMFSSDEQQQIRSMLSSSLQGVVSQALLKRVDVPGMVPAVEIMVCNPAVRACIRENRVFEIANIMETSRAAGMQSLDYYVEQLFKNGYVSRHDAIAHMSRPERLGVAKAA